MTIYSNYISPFVHFCALEATTRATEIFSDRRHTQIKVAVVALAIIFSLAALVYCTYYLAEGTLFLDLNEPLQKQTAEFASHIDKILRDSSLDNTTREELEGLSSFLKYTDHKKDILDYCTITDKEDYGDYLFQSFMDSYTILCKIFNDEQFPMEKKLEVLKRLGKERYICITGFAGLLSDVCSSVDEPTDKAEILPWLIACYKQEVIKLITPAVAIHSVHGFIAHLGEELGLLPSVIKAAKADNYVAMFSSESLSSEFDKFRSSCTSKGCLTFLESFINADFPHRAAYRTYILSWLANRVPDEKVDDQAIQASILAKHKTALENEEKREKARLEQKFKGRPAPEFDAEWNRVLKKIKLKENPFIDAAMYASYHYRINTEDSEDTKLTPEAIELFAKEAFASDAILSG